MLWCLNKKEQNPDTPRDFSVGSYLNIFILYIVLAQSPCIGGKIRLLTQYCATPRMLGVYEKASAGKLSRWNSMGCEATTLGDRGFLRWGWGNAWFGGHHN